MKDFEFSIVLLILQFPYQYLYFHINPTVQLLDKAYFPRHIYWMQPSMLQHATGLPQRKRFLV